MLGLRPTLRPRPSLLDLVFHVPKPSFLPSHPSPDDHFAAASTPLPTSPTKQSFQASSITAEEAKEAPIEAPRTVKMAKDSGRKQQEAGEDRYGSVFSVSGPVIVAENMIGCAMYELVCIPPSFGTSR